MSEPFTAELTVERCLSGKRIDSFLACHFRNYTPFRMQRLVRAGQVIIDGVPVSWDHRVFAGQRVTVLLTEPPDNLMDAEPDSLFILYEDSWLLAVNKPAGQPVHPGGSFQAGTLANAVQHYLDLQTPLKGLLRPGIVHRLDRLTSGVMIVAKEHLSHRRLTRQFEQRKVVKSYLALTHGVIEEDEIAIDRPIGVIVCEQGRLMSASRDARAARRAWTHITVGERFRDHTFVVARPFTGRLHQIRVHLASIGHPIVADSFYGPSSTVDEAETRRSGTACRPSASSADRDRFLHRQALHAWQIGFRHPITQQYMVLEATLPEDIQMALTRLRAPVM